MTLDEHLFLARIEERYRQAGHDPLTRLRAKAWDRLKTIGFPSRKHVHFKTIRLRSLYSHPLQETQPLTPAELLPPLPPSAIRLVFVNGSFSLPHSSCAQLPPKAVLKNLSEAMAGGYSSLLNGKKFLDEENPFTLVNTACQAQGMFLYIPPKVVLEEPIQVVHLVTGAADNALLLPKLSLFLGAESEVKIAYETVYQGELVSPFVNGLFDYDLEEGANLHLTETLIDAPARAIHLQSHRATLKRHSQLKSVYLTNGASIARNDFRVALNGEGGRADLFGLWVLRQRKECHQHVRVEHNAPHCHSMQLFKGVLHDEGHSSFDGKIWVDPIAQKTEAYQLNHNLLLSPNARAETQPNLEIFADDVKASHGATVGDLPEEQLFYLLTRGISREKAEEILIYAFCQEIVKLTPYNSWKKVIEGGYDG